MIDVVMIGLVILLIGGATAWFASRSPASLRPWIWAGFAEYMLAATAQLLYVYKIYGGGDATVYAETGAWLAKLLDRNFGFVAPELLALLFHRPSVFDTFVYGGGGGNTGSMHAVAGWLIFAFRGSTYAPFFLVAGLSFFGTLSIFVSFRDSYADVPEQRLFAAAVLFPSVAFWTSSLHKEAFCVMGIGLLLVSWRGLYRQRWLRVLTCGPVGLAVLYLFRAPALAPLFFGLLVYFVLQRLQKTRGPAVAVVGPLYVVLALGALIVGMLTLARLVPSLGIDRLGESVATQQGNWVAGANDSTFRHAEENAGPQTLGRQLLSLPLGLVNALFRPQLFDVHNFSALISATEMTAITVVVIQLLRRNGLTKLVTRVQRSPFLAMCAVVTFVGCAFVGLVTFNFGSLARYRVPFLPFYGALLAGLSVRVATVKAAAPRRGAVRLSPRELALARRRTATTPAQSR